MISCATTEMIQVRIVELVARRNALAAFVMNTDLGMQARILDDQILVLRTMLVTNSIPEINDDLFAWPNWDRNGKRTDKGLKI